MSYKLREIRKLVEANQSDTPVFVWRPTSIYLYTPVPSGYLYLSGS